MTDEDAATTRIAPEDGGQDMEEIADPTTDDSAAAVDAEVLDALREEWGEDFDANLALAREAAQTIADDELVELLDESGLGNDPRMLRAAARIGWLLHSADRNRRRDPLSADGEALQTTLDELSRRPDYWTDEVQRRVRQTHLALHGDGRISVHRAVGDGGGR